MHIDHQGQHGIQVTISINSSLQLKMMMSVLKICLLKTPGACFPSLQGASALLKASEVVYVWGGLNLDVYKTTDELYILKLKPNDKCEVEILQNMMLDD